jgi:XRE family transcriptional regulator, regulator of sulfur utilization
MLGIKKPKPGRPRGAKTFDLAPALAFGGVVKTRRLELGLSQEELAISAHVERSHMGKIERGEHLPNLVLILRLAKALSVKPGLLLDRVAEILSKPV